MLHEVDRESLIEAATSIGKTNRMWNRYAAVINECDKLAEMGLEPVVLMDDFGSQIIITSRELQQGKFN